VPRTREELMALPGVGRKVANLVLNICFDEAAICVDTHVHRIANRLGWVATATPEETELKLMELVPKKYWALLNRVLVNHGQQICHPTSPKCSQCSVDATCARFNVVNYR
jgi:endonuclease III